MWVLGTIGNILAMIIFSRKTMVGSLSVFLFRFLAVFDFIAVQDHIQGWLRYIQIDLFDHHDWSCRIIFWVFHSCQMVSVWILVAIGVERLIGVVWPHQAKILCTINRGKIFLVILICTSFFINSFHTLTLKQLSYYDIYLQRVMLICNYVPSPDSWLYDYVNDIRPWILFLVYSGIPFVLIFGVNATIIGTLIHRQSLRMVSISNYYVNYLLYLCTTGMLVHVNMTMSHPIVTSNHISFYD